METTAIKSRRSYSKPQESLNPPRYQTIMALVGKYNEPLRKIKASRTDMNLLSMTDVKSYSAYFESTYSNYNSRNAWQYCICIYYYNLCLASDKKVPISAKSEFLLPPMAFISEFRGLMTTNSFFY